ncbi:uncharacterized protein MYCGRDRAFT_97885 [Zymoseptoria tritici IPO323]|uniref:Uncharacterized protein n=1 Tax=Zymoseptoria tritici (strain CBS 115943 / IPO323) TaxID=336722 RepID=F9XRP0_ZYMTI|nr:uncharacterized protein MYCGRDRAFT_97885 [Zymoseptoria tritici IPO323]EGP82068.1 hypothetical protein MYCGRDRAFT_97885 [Zymoseptoria tritici IPO323]
MAEAAAAWSDHDLSASRRLHRSDARIPRQVERDGRYGRRSLRSSTDKLTVSTFGRGFPKDYGRAASPARRANGEDKKVVIGAAASILSMAVDGLFKRTKKTELGSASHEKHLHANQRLPSYELGLRSDRPSSSFAQSAHSKLRRKTPRRKRQWLKCSESAYLDPIACPDRLSHIVVPLYCTLFFVIRINNPVGRCRGAANTVGISAEPLMLTRSGSASLDSHNKNDCSSDPGASVSECAYKADIIQQGFENIYLVASFQNRTAACSRSPSSEMRPDPSPAPTPNVSTPASPAQEAPKERDKLDLAKRTVSTAETNTASTLFGGAGASPFDAIGTLRKGPTER